MVVSLLFDVSRVNDYAAREIDGGESPQRKGRARAW